MWRKLAVGLLALGELGFCPPLRLLPSREAGLAALATAIYFKGMTCRPLETPPTRRGTYTFPEVGRSHN